MAFNNTVLQDNPDLGAGEVITASPYNVSAFELFEDGLVEGRFAMYAAGQIDNMDGATTPVVAASFAARSLARLEPASIAPAAKLLTKLPR